MSQINGNSAVCSTDRVRENVTICITGTFGENFPVTHEFPHMASNEESVSMLLWALVCHILRNSSEIAAGKSQIIDSVITSCQMKKIQFQEKYH